MDSRAAKQVLSETILAAIGDAISSWSALEMALTQHLAHFVTHDSTDANRRINALVLTVGMSVETTVGLLKSLVRMHFPGSADDFDKLGDSIISAYKNRRNTVAHKMWACANNDDRVKIWDIKTVGTIKMETRDITATELRNWAADFRAFSGKVQDFMLALGLPAIPDFS